jgi:tetratricopeptide (TPR) repeat protein
MKKIFITPLLILSLLLLIAAGKIFYKPVILPLSFEKHDIISCGFPASDISANEDGKFIPLLPGWGHHSYAISTANDSTQIYFNQGLNFYYGYHFREALASFKEAARFDKTCAMAYWGQALAMGPYYNNYYYKMGKGLPAVLREMNNNMATTTAKEKELIKAMQQRYSTDTSNADRPQLDSSYASAMHLLVKQFISDDDIKALYIDAAMLQHKWDFWNNDGSPKNWTPELVTLCQGMLLRQRLHPAALHYYIHLTEASHEPQLALRSAELLKEAMPGVGHMVHMATHMYQRNGLFAKGVAVNEDANTVNNNVDDLAPNLHIGKNNIVHVYAVQSYCALNAGIYSKGIPMYQRAKNRMLALAGGIENDAHNQEVFMLPVIAMVRMGKWQEILAAPAPDKSWKYAVILDCFAKGLAQLHNKNDLAAKQLLDQLEATMLDSLLAVRSMPFNAPVQMARVAAGILKGELFYAEGKNTEALNAFKTAVEEEDKLIYREPQEWMLPARQYLGAYLLKMKQPALAEKVYREDLVANPNNGWSLLGLFQSLQAVGKKGEAALYKDSYIAAFKDADTMPVASIY